ncbi:MAG: preprotein translocase subunit SecG [Planctomycetes bacterium]|nr:preprotein translocase subunit SecG [Planctomycetota bacterium]
MSIWFVIVTVLFMLVSLGMVLIILVQRPQGGGLAGAFGGAGGSSTDTVFGGRVGDALTVATVVAFALYLLLAVGLNLLDNVGPGGVTATPAAVQAGPVPDTGPGAGLGDTLAPDLGATFPTAVAETPPPDDAVPIIDPSDSDQSNDDTDDDPGER